MDYTGLVVRYLVDRPLKEEERERQLHQKQRLKVDPGYHLSVIRFNSTYMELVDKWFEWKGLVTTVTMTGIGLIIYALLSMIMVTLADPNHSMAEDGPFLLAIFAIMSPVFALGVWLLKKDSFRFTHYPVRLNRRTRMVHVFRTDGTVLSASWDGVFFCIGALPRALTDTARSWEIKGHILDKEGVTVRETFAPFPVYAYGDSERDENLPRAWEFMRRYMEDGPGAVAEHVEHCLPIVDRRETFTTGFYWWQGRNGTLPLPLQIPLLLIYFIIWPGRWFAMRTSKIPVWPKEIEEVCVVAANDPFRKDASMNEPITDHTAIYLVAFIGLAALATLAWWIGW